MPLENFIPGADPAGIDASKTYLVKGSTLKELLRKTLFSLSDFAVAETPASRMVSLRRQIQENGMNFRLVLRNVALNIAGTDPDFVIQITQNYEPYEFLVRDGRFVTQGSTAEASDVPTYAFIGRITTDADANNDSGPIYYEPGEYGS